MLEDGVARVATSDSEVVAQLRECPKLWLFRIFSARSMNKGLAFATNQGQLVRTFGALTS
jgi:hypothetical protein